MTDKITENTIENFCIKLLDKQGYEYIYAPDITPEAEALDIIPQAEPPDIKVVLFYHYRVYL
jgi:hypothetical protein